MWSAEHKPQRIDTYKPSTLWTILPDHMIRRTCLLVVLLVNESFACIDTCYCDRITKWLIIIRTGYCTILVENYSR